ncbi:uncharacterized protein LOC106159527 [Lingula anatina]|uniref:Uncharacterized protein LOC106159527 n=1 Tax=Lingula anatina TaxID=7574 RepID=A0A1S3I0D2_LINAN|nr:uncharacterized protein LOC106159527 [Lingula anatina]|eukprot:XP_013391281.2 uncharacterized protein LOC106159527 [Lingula anatina]
MIKLTQRSFLAGWFDLDKKVLFISPHISALALECYECRDQDNNNDRCVKEHKLCDPHQDACITQVEWKVPPYWTPRADRIFYITKGCDTSDSCKKMQSQIAPMCRPNDYQMDWHCIQCCKGDRCNFEATMGAGTARAGVLSVVIGLFSLLMLRIF